MCHVTCWPRTTRIRDVSFGANLSRRKHLSKSCPDIRLVSLEPRHHAVLSTFGKCRPVALQYDCVADDCCSVDVDKMFSCDAGRVCLGRRYVDLFSGLDAVYPAAEALYDGRSRLASQPSYQSSYGTLQHTALGGSRAARVRAFLSTDRSGKQSSVVCETTRLNSAVCRPIITTRHHKVTHTLSARLYDRLLVSLLYNYIVYNVVITSSSSSSSSNFL